MELFEQIVIYKEGISKKLSKARNYFDLAYVKGYIEGLSIPLDYDNIEDFPFFFIYGLGSTNDVKLAYKTFENNIIYHKASEKYGNQYFKEYLKEDNNIVIHHRPFT